MRNVFIVLFMTISCFIGSAQLISMEPEVIFISPEKRTGGFKELGENKFQFTTERGQSVVRTLEDYKLYESEKALHAAVSKTKALIFGGAHLLAEEAFQLSKAYAQSGDLHLMYNAGYHGHEGHTVINLDPNSKPDFIENFMEENLIARLGLTGQFSTVSMENIKPSLSLDHNTISNAWDALSPGGVVIIYPANVFHQELLKERGFLIIKFYSNGEVYKDILVHRNVPFGAVVAKKPNN